MSSKLESVDALRSLGWGTPFSDEWQSQPEPHLTPMRVAIEHQDRYTLVGDRPALDAHLTGTLLKAANKRGMRPAVGDWVGLGSEGLIEHIYERRTAFQRLSPRGKLQVVAANIDLVLLVTSCNLEFNLRRVERYLAAIWQSGAEPAIVLSKTDLADAPEEYEEKLRDIAGTAPVFPVATPLRQGVDAVAELLDVGKTLALVGSSGVGKSTLANALLGVELFDTAPIREQDAKGRHTTTRRELVVLSEGRGVLIDTPGMRELQMVSTAEGLDRAFPDVASAARTCKFRDCSHGREPGCAVRDTIPEARLASYQRLKNECEAAERKAQRQRR